MLIRFSQPPHLKKPLTLLLLGILLYSVLVVAALYFTDRFWFIESSHYYISAVPGLAISTVFILLWSYMRYNDELMKDITIKSLAATCLVGMSAQIISVSRAMISDYPQFSGQSILFLTALTFVIVSIYLSWKFR